MKHRSSDTAFPDPSYAETVLAPLFESTRKHHADLLMKINRAHCVMLFETGLLDRETAGSIALGLKEIGDRKALGDLTYNAEHEDFFFAVEAALAQRLGPDVAGRLHTGRSRNDMDHAIFRLALRLRMDRLIQGALELANTLHARVVADAATITVGYTHGQPAQPTTLAHYLGGVLDVLLRDIERLMAAREVVDRSPMGSAAITTTGFEIDRDRMAELLGFSGITGNSYASIAGVDYVTGAYSAIKLLLLHLGRCTQDFQFWSSFEVGQLTVPDGFVQISSIMPQKRNPVPIEHLRLMASRGIGEAETVVMTMHNTPFTDMNDSEGEIQAAGYRAFETTGRLLTLMNALIGQVTVNAQNVRDNINRACITITELADTLVRENGLSFRQAHEICMKIARHVLANGGTLSSHGYTALSQAFAAEHRPLSMDEARFREVVSPENFVRVRERPGGPGPKSIAAASAGYRGLIDDFAGRMDASIDRILAADQLLESAFTDLTPND